MSRQRQVFNTVRYACAALAAVLLAGTFPPVVFGQPATQPCHLIPTYSGIAAYIALPDTHYLYNEPFGWFDTSHFNTGRPMQVLSDVRAAAANGGGIISIHQGIHDGITGYTGRYAVSGDLSAEDVAAAALGIYLDWSVRFERWQASPPQGLLGPTSPFAVEDLPSQYLGFIAAALDVPIERLFACYLGPVTGTDEGPPDFVLSDQTADEDGWAGLTRLDNTTFVPLVPSDQIWHYVNWPAELQLPSLSTGPDTWHFLSEVTWFMGDNTNGPTHGKPGRLRRLR